ncbi:MAG: cupin domain-containing protein [Chloroflexota bacterium]
MLPHRFDLPRRMAALGVAVLLLLVSLAPVAAQDGALWTTRVFAVTHAAVTTELVTPGSDGHQLGDIRVNVATPTYFADGTPAGRYDAMLVTTTVDYPNVGDEVRMVQLNFIFGEAQADQFAGSADQLIVSGSGYYPAGGSTLRTGTSLVRTIAGGSGEFAGATGWAESDHLEDGTWRHVFHVLLPAGAILAALDAPAPVASPAASPAAHAGHGATAAADPGAFQRILVGSVEPETAPGQTLTLWAYHIPPGYQLAPHRHPGYQVARVLAGTLTFHVLEGTAIHVRADGSEATLGAGDVVALQTGDAVIENPGARHFGGNDGDVAVELTTATLFASDAPPAILLASPSPAP